ncbi:MAG TPA: TrkH family potassium uptake protein [Solirubrobacteraceae bacterium]|nr:TrkH family potassium uptake protein [Solirubrobacteraceae bacterium]
MERAALRAPGALRAVGVDVPGALNLVGYLVKYLGAAFLFPAAIAVAYGEPAWPFLVAAAATAGFGLGLERVTTGRERIGSREGYLVVSLIWVLVAAFGSLPYLLAEPQLARPVDALFESMSGFSTTGSSVVRRIDELSRSMAMWRQFTAWIGGVGIIVMFIAVLPRLRVGGRQALFKTEAPGPELPLATTIRQSATRFVVLYVGLTALEIAVLTALGWTGVDPRMDLFNATAHAFTTIATAGFSPEPRSIEPFAPATQWAIAVFMLLAGTNFALLYAVVVARRPRLIARDEEVRTGAVVLVLASAIVVVELLSADTLDGAEALRHGVFNTTSMMTTTGYASDDFNEWTPLTALVLFGIVLIGASAGSTGGSIKLVRHLVIAKMLMREIDQTVHPEVVAPLRVNREVVDDRALRAIIVFVFLYLGVCAAGAVVILVDSALSGIDLTAFQALAAAASVLGGAGPGLGFAGPMGSFEPFSDVSTLTLTALMYLGRLEIVPVLVLFTASHWRA